MELQLCPLITLNNSFKIPQIGLATFNPSEGDIISLVKTAIIDHGYRHIDTASLYDNEEAIGESLKECIASGIN